MVTAATRHSFADGQLIRIILRTPGQDQDLVRAAVDQARIQRAVTHLHFRAMDRAEIVLDSTLWDTVEDGLYLRLLDMLKAIAHLQVCPQKLKNRTIK